MTARMIKASHLQHRASQFHPSLFTLQFLSRFSNARSIWKSTSTSNRFADQSFAPAASPPRADRFVAAEIAYMAQNRFERPIAGAPTDHLVSDASVGSSFWKYRLRVRFN